jgi:hypothetical protein
MDRRLAALPAQASVAEIVRGVIEADVAAFSGAQEQSDDITLLVLRYAPRRSGNRLTNPGRMEPNMTTMAT